MLEYCGCRWSTLYCAKYQIAVTIRQHDFLRGTSGLSKEKEQAYIARILQPAIGSAGLPVPRTAEKLPRRDQQSRRTGVATPPSGGLGDYIANALSSVGLTEERVTSWLGRPCGCKERRERLNALGNWAKRILSGKAEKATEYLDEIITSDKPEHEH